MTNSEARKRMQARSGPESPLSRPQTANLGDGAIGLSEDERCALDDAITSAIYLAAETRKPTGHRIAAAVERILAARAQPEGKTRVEWGVRWDT